MSAKKPVISVVGCGWLGLPLAAFLVQQGYTVRGSTTSREKLPLLSKEGIEAYLFKSTADSGEVPGGTSESAAIFQSDILYLNIPPGRRRADVETAYPREIKNVVDQALLGKVKRILFVSSTGVYPDNNGVVNETHPLAASRRSGRALIRVEEQLQQLAEAKVTILRMAGLVGGERKAGRFLAGKKNLQNGESPVNLVHLRDCIGVSYEVIRQERWGEIYNVCADQHPTRAMFYTYQALKENLAPPSFGKPEKGSFKIVSNEKVKRELNYQFRFPDPMDF